jgi:hypothetical protein
VVLAYSALCVYRVCPGTRYPLALSFHTHFSYCRR